MGLLEFSKLPVNTLVGAKWNTFQRTAKGSTIDKGYKSKYYLTKSICRLLSLLQPIEDARVKKLKQSKEFEFENEPVFILGHWRSGTTFLHTILSLDDHFGYNTTYQTVFPNLMLFGQSFFKKSMAYLMPDKRPTDNMELNVDLPQEEEFALSNLTPVSYYNFWFYPKRWSEFTDKYLTFKDASNEELEEFKTTFRELVKVSLHNTNGTQFLSKNPPHTARVKEILEIYPNAKFIYLMRNPYTVFESTRSFFTNTIQPLKLQDITESEIEEHIIDVYKIMYDKYESDKSLIPEGNLIEVKFEDVEKDALGVTKMIYDQLKLTGFEESREAIEAYLNKKKGYKKNSYKYNPRTIEIVESNWGFALKQWGYDLEK
ncbi:MAG: sulfotransferase family protein [Bacteroidales bacterium]